MVAAIVAAGATGFLIARPASNEVAARAPESLVAAPAATNAGVPLGGSELDASGHVVAARRATVSSETTGRLAEVLVKEGDRVVKGQVLARLDARDLAQQIRLAEAQLASAATAIEQHDVDRDAASERLARMRELNAGSFVSDDELSAARHAMRRFEALRDRARSELVVAQQRVAVHHQLMQNSVIVAPFDGMVTERSAQVGEIVSPISAGGGFTRTGICTLIDTSSLEARVRVNEKFIGRVRQGQPVEIIPRAYPDLRLRGHVATIMPAAERETASVEVIVRFVDRDPRVLPNMSVDVGFNAVRTSSAKRPTPLAQEAQP